MRVLWVVHNLAYPPVRGVLQRNFNLLRQAAKKCEVHVLAFDQPASRPNGVSAEDCAEALRQFCVHVEWLPIADGISKSKHWLGLRGLLSSSAYDLNWMASPSMATRLQATLASVKFDVVHFDTLGLAQYQKYVVDAGSVLNHHNIESSMMEHRAVNETRSIPRRYWRLEAKKLRNAERYYCPQVAQNLVVSNEDGETLLALAPNCKTTVVANGVDTEFFTPRVDPGGKSLLFVGGLDWYPNGQAMEYFFSEIWPDLIRREPGISATVVGRNPPKWLSQLGVADPRVKVTGFVNDVRSYFREATLYVCPITSGGGTRLKILDALAMGMPLVGTTFACSGISLEGDRHVLLADSPQGFADQVIRALTDPALRARLANEGRDHVSRNFSWSTIGDNLHKAYFNAAATRPTRSSANY